MSVALRVDPHDTTPPYEQLRAQLAAVIDAGTLAEGARLPPVRQLARDLGVAVGTVARAYRELEAAGLVRTRRGGGTTVAAPPAAVAARVARAVAAARARGVPDDVVAATVEEALAHLPTSPTVT